MLVHLILKDTLNYTFKPTKELCEELEEALHSGDWVSEPIIIKKKGNVCFVIINDPLSIEMMTKLYIEQIPTEWKSILRYLYVMV